MTTPQNQTDNHANGHLNAQFHADSAGAPASFATQGGNLFLGPTWPETKLGQFMLKGFGRVLFGAIKGSEFLKSVGVEVGLPTNGRDERDALSDWLDAKGWPAMPLQLGLVDAGPWATSLVAARGVFRPDWQAMVAPASENAMQGMRLDAAIEADDTGTLSVRTIENSGRDAAWFDWNNERPLSYPSVFPSRLDCTQLTLETDATGSVDALLARLLIEAASLLSRYPQRLTLEDRLHGRNAGWSSNDENADADHDPLTIVCTALTDALTNADASTRRSPAARCAARLLSSWAATSQGVRECTTRAAAEASWDVNANEAPTALRVAAVRLAQMDDPAGLEALEHATDLLRAANSPLNADQIEFILSELRTQSTQPEGVARIAAGIVLIGATLPAEHLQHFKEDFLDDAKLFGSLVGQDQDTHLVLQVFRMLERKAGVKYLDSTPEAPRHASWLSETPPTFAFNPAATKTTERVTTPKLARILASTTASKTDAQRTRAKRRLPAPKATTIARAKLTFNGKPVKAARKQETTNAKRSNAPSASTRLKVANKDAKKVGTKVGNKSARQSRRAA